MKRFISILTALAMFVSLTNPMCACTFLAAAHSSAMQMQTKIQAQCAGGHRHVERGHGDGVQADRGQAAEQELPPADQFPPHDPADLPGPQCQLHSGTLLASFASGVDVLPVWSAAPLVTLPMQSLPPSAAWVVATEAREGCDHRVRALRPLLRQHCALIS